MRGLGGSLLLILALSLQADLCVMTWLLGYVDPSDPCFVAAVFTIIFNPLFWNVVSAARRLCRQGEEPLSLPSLPVASVEPSLLLAPR